MNPYETLGVKADATEDQIKAAYRKACKLHHPDKGGDREKFQEVHRAFEVLGDSELRAEYDRTGRMPDQPANVDDIQITVLKAFAEKMLDNMTYKSDGTMGSWSVLSELRFEFQDKITTIRSKVKMGRDQIAELIRQKRKIRCKKSPAEATIFDGWIESQIAQFQGDITKLEASALKFERCLKFLEDFESDEPERPAGEKLSVHIGTGKIEEFFRKYGGAGFR